MAEMYRGADGPVAAPGRARDLRRAQLWELARAHRIGRRRFLRLLSTGGAASVIAACAGQPQSGRLEPAAGAYAANGWFKDSGPFIEHGGQSLEARLENLDGLVTPARQFFVRNNSRSLDLDASEWRLQVAGDAVGNPRDFSYQQIRELPVRKLTAYLECAGNHRAMFDIVNGRRASGTQWMTGAIGNGDWAGTPLREVLALAGMSDQAVSVQLIGLDLDSPEQGFRYVLPMSKAMHPDTLLVHSLNGEPLPRDHGFPLRALVPGWVGAASVKWLGRIEVARRPIFGRTNTTSYVLIGDRFPANSPAQGDPVHAQVIKSALALPWPARIPAGRTRLRGFAQSPTGPITRVAWSADSGTSWAEAELVGSQPDYSWARFEFSWDATPGEHTIMTRATDAAGNNQPAEVPFNAKGYLFNQPLPHPVQVT